MRLQSSTKLTAAGKRALPTIAPNQEPQTTGWFNQQDEAQPVKQIVLIFE